MKKIAISLPYLFVFVVAIFFRAGAQVYTTTYPSPHVTARGMFGKTEKIAEVMLPLQDTAELLRQERLRDQKDGPYRFATSIPLDISLRTHGQWEKIDSGMMVWRLKLTSKNAYSTSINFDRFHLPDDATLFIYNGAGTMITGPITSKENNLSGFWGSSIYGGESVFVELKASEASLTQCELHIANLAHGFKPTNIQGVGSSATCNIDVTCPLGVGWENERTSVAWLLDDLSTINYSGALVMNTCNNNTPYFLTANHALTHPDGTPQNVGQWKFTFFYESTACGSGIYLTSVLFNGSTYKASNPSSDFALVQLNQTPASTTGLHYAGWNRANTPATSATCIHHPKGDLKKISHDNDPVVPATFPGLGPLEHWRAIFDQGIIQPGSSGSPLFDQNKRIVGQLTGSNNTCIGANDNNVCWCSSESGTLALYGRFDISWTGGGHDNDRLSNWLDASNTGFLTTNTTNVRDLGPTSGNTPGPIVNCLPNLSYCNGATGTPINFSSNVSGAVFSWTSRVNVGFGTGGTGNISSFPTVFNSSSTPLVTLVTVTATANNVTGPPTTFTVTINPTPNVTIQSSYNYCNFFTLTPGPSFSSTVAGTMFTWTCNPDVGFGTSGTTTGPTASFIPVNNTNSNNPPVSAVMRVFASSANGCAGTPPQGIGSSVLIWATPVVNAVPNVVYNHGDAAAAIAFSTSTPSVPAKNYEWLGTAGVGFIQPGNTVLSTFLGIPAFTATNNTNAPIVNAVEVHGIGFNVGINEPNGCISTPAQSKTFTVTVNPILSSSFQSKSNCACHGGNTATISVAAAGGTPSYTYTIAGPTVNTTGASSGQFTGLAAGTYSVTARDAGSHTSTVSNIGITEPSGTAPDAVLSVSDYTDNFFPANASEVTLIYQMGEVGGNPCVNNLFRITKQTGYVFSMPAVSTLTVGGNAYPIDNSRWTADNSDPIFYNASLNSGQQLGCGQFVNLAVRIVRTTPNRSEFTLTSQVRNVSGEVNTVNNATTIILVGQ